MFDKYKIELEKYASKPRNPFSHSHIEFMEPFCSAFNLLGRLTLT